jgi:predicted glutamine amidotransferase
MCRWLAYAGPDLLMERLLFAPSNSLIKQSLSAQQSIVPTNGDGFGLGWYGSQPRPGLFRDTLPAWNDANLRSISEQIRSRLFFAHVRASTGTSTSRENCHPFRHEDSLFMHNGRVGGFGRIRREIEQLIPGEFYGQRHGTTDSEAFFLLALGYGLIEEPVRGLSMAIRSISKIMQKRGIDEPFRMTAAFSDGDRLVAIRHSSDFQSPSLYWTTGKKLTVKNHSVGMSEGQGATLVLSEPLDAGGLTWHEVPESHVLTSVDGVVTIDPIELAA